MSVVDKILGWLLVAFGVANCVGTFAMYHPLNRSAIWFFGSGVALIAVGMLNLIRARKPDAFTRGCCVLANALLLVMSVALMWELGRGVMHSPQALAITAITLLELVFSAGK